MAKDCFCFKMKGKLLDSAKLHLTVNSVGKNCQTRSQVLRFGGQNTFLEGKYFCVYCMFKTNFSGHKKFGRHWPQMPTGLRTAGPRQICPYLKKFGQPWLLHHS